jgi:hypothetical protein
MRAECSKAARAVCRKAPLNEADLEECAQLDEALGGTHRLLKATVRRIMLSRIGRRGRRSRTSQQE